MRASGVQWLHFFMILLRRIEQHINGYFRMSSKVIDESKPRGKGGDIIAI